MVKDLELLLELVDGQITHALSSFLQQNPCILGILLPTCEELVVNIVVEVHLESVQNLKRCQHLIIDHYSAIDALFNDLLWREGLVSIIQIVLSNFLLNFLKLQLVTRVQYLDVAL